MNDYDGNYVWLKMDPSTPIEKYPLIYKCKDFEFMKMSQLCEIAERHGLGRSPACNAFGGDRGKFKVSNDRQARAVKHGKTVRKFVLSTAAITYLAEKGINNW